MCVSRKSLKHTKMIKKSITIYQKITVVVKEDIVNSFIELDWVFENVVRSLFDAVYTLSLTERDDIVARRRLLATKMVP